MYFLVYFGKLGQFSASLLLIAFCCYYINTIFLEYLIYSLLIYPAKTNSEEPSQELEVDMQ